MRLFIMAVICNIVHGVKEHFCIIVHNTYLMGCIASLFEPDHSAYRGTKNKQDSAIPL